MVVPTKGFHVLWSVVSVWLVLFQIAVQAQNLSSNQWVTHAYQAEVPGIEANPLKGMFPYDDVENRSFPHSLEWFYVPLNELQSAPDKFDWEPIERRLQAIAGRGHHAVFRVFLDYPGKPVGTPKFLIDAGVVMRRYSEMGNENGASQSPDWNDARLVSALEGFITHFGRKYDGDPRIGFITIGLYGFWGEWHNYPHDPEWAMSETNRDRLLTAYTKAFTKTRVVLRDPLGTTNAVLKTAVGYHDDSFAYETLSPEWAFRPKLRANGLADIWKTQPIGGEIRPELQAKLFDAWPNPTMMLDGKLSESFPECIAVTHVSWLLNNDIFERPLTEAQRANALRAQRLLGYEFHVTATRTQWSSEVKLRVEVKLKNTGVAPFYYDWAAEFAAWDTEKKSLHLLGKTTDWKLPEIQPDNQEYLRAFVASPKLSRGNYRLLLRLVNPLPNGNSLRFANPQQDRDQYGWLTLGEFDISSR